MNLVASRNKNSRCEFSDMDKPFSVATRNKKLLAGVKDEKA